MILALFASLAAAASGGWWLEGPLVSERATADSLEQVADRAGYDARVVKRFRLGEGWEFVTLVEGFADEASASAAARRLSRDAGQTFVLVHDPAKGPPTRTSVGAEAPAGGPTASALLGAARAAHGGPTGGAAALARARAVHFVFAREFELGGKLVKVDHDYWREVTNRRVDVKTHGVGTDSLSVATAKGAWLRAAGKVEVRDIGVLIGQADAFAPEAILGVALDVDTLLGGPDTGQYLVLEGAESGVRVGRGEDPTEPGLAFADIDPATGLLSRVRYVTEAGPVVIELSGWAPASPGVVFPALLSVERPDGRRETIRVQRLEIAEGAPAGTFAVPEITPTAP